MPRSRIAKAGALAAVAVLSLAACGDDDSDSSEDTGSALEGRGPITYVSGKDTSGNLQNQIDAWNKDHPDEKVRLIELPESADQQRQQMVQNAQTKSDAYTILDLDVVWTAEFAANKWIEELPKDEFDSSAFLPSAIDSATYRDKLYGAPRSSDGGLLYYRTDLLEKVGAEAPTTWAEMESTCDKVLELPEAKGMSCYAGQYEKYEGLTVNFDEAVHSAGGTILDESGKPNVNTPEAKKGLDFLVDGFDSGMIPKEGITYKEEEGRRAFQDGKLVFHRQWPYQYALANKDDGSSKVAGKFDVAPLPGLDGPGTSSLGGHNLAISSYAKNKATALDFMKWITSEDQQRANLLATSSAPTLSSLYDDPELEKKYPYLPTLKDSIESAVPRPKAVNYGDVTAAIQNDAYAALTGEKTSEKALQDMQTELEGLITE